MRLSLQTDYALRTLMFLAAHEGQHSIAEIAAKYLISKNHLMKVAQKLVAEGFVASVRGRGGGLRLGKPAASINVGQVIRTFEDMGAFVECFDRVGGGCIVSPVCGLRHILAGSVEAFLCHLDGFVLSDLVGDPSTFRSAFHQSGRDPPKETGDSPNGKAQPG